MFEGSSDIRSGSSEEKFEFALFMPHMPMLRTKSAGWRHLSGGSGSPPPEFESDDDRSYYLVRLPAHPPAPDSKQVSGETESGAHDKTQVEAQAGTRSVLNRDQVEPQSRAQSRARSEVILHALSKCPYSTNELMLKLKLKSKTGAFKQALNELLSNSLIEYTIPDKPASRLQKYRLTEKGRKILENK